MDSSRAAVTAVFFVNGMLFGSLFVRLPALQEELAIGDGALGLALLAGALGLLAAALVTGGVVSRLGSTPVVVAGALGYCASLPLAALAPGYVTFCLALAALGATSGALDVAMNAQGIEVERRRPRRVFASFHAAFSFGGLAGAAVGGIVAEAGVAPLPHFAAVAGALALASLVACRGLLPAAADAAPEGPRLARPSWALATLGALALCALIAEGSVADWSAIHLSRSLEASPGMAAAGLGAFSLTMGFGRLAGDRLADAFGPVALTRAGALLAACGLGLALLAPAALAAIAGFGLMGAGLAAIFPLTLAAAGHAEGSAAAGPAIGAVTATGYIGFLLGPALIGFLSELGGLRPALTLVVALCLVVALLAPGVEPRRRPA